MSVDCTGEEPPLAAIQPPPRSRLPSSDTCVHREARLSALLTSSSTPLAWSLKVSKVVKTALAPSCSSPEPMPKSTTLSDLRFDELMRATHTTTARETMATATRICGEGEGVSKSS